MSQKVYRSFWWGCVFFLCVGVGSWVSCAGKEKPECTENTDCLTKGANQICYQQKCRARAKEGEECNELDGLICQKENDDTPSKPLICATSVCKVKCTTNFDCKTRDGETCDTKSGLCIRPSGDGGTEQVVEGPVGKGESEDCSPTVACQSGLDCVKRSTTVNEGKCWKICQKDTDCATGQLCSAGHCVPQQDTCEVQGGQQVKPCWPGLMCVLDSAASGNCLRACKDTTECPKDYECATQGAAKYCVTKTDRAGAGQPCGDIGGKTVGCVDGHTCANERIGSTQKICLKNCTQDSECAWPSFCQGSICTLGNAGSAKLGTACSTKTDATDAQRCEGGHYCQVVKQGSQDGFCYRDCGDPRKTDCPTGLTCLGTGGTQKLCLKTCTKAEDCATNAPATTCVQPQGTTIQVCLHPAN